MRRASFARLTGAVFTVGALVLAGSATASASVQAAHPSRSNATFVCGFRCFDLSNLQLDGTGVGALLQNAHGGVAGTSINMRGEGDAKTNEDFEAGSGIIPFVTVVGTVATAGTACGNGLFPPTSIFCIHPGFAFDFVFESDFAPDSNQTGLCVGLPTADVSTRLALEPCGSSTTTLWVADAFNGRFAKGVFYTPWLNGGDTNFSHPLALTVNPSSKHPLNVLRADEENTTGGLIPDTQEFFARPGPA